MNLTKDELLNHELRHRYSGNGYAVVEIIGPVKEFYGTNEYVRVTDKWCKGKQAFMAAVDHLMIEKKFNGVNPDGTPYPSEPILLTEEELDKLRPLREGIADGSLKVVRTRFVKTPTATPAATV